MIKISIVCVILNFSFVKLLVDYCIVTYAIIAAAIILSSYKFAIRGREQLCGVRGGDHSVIISNQETGPVELSEDKLPNVLFDVFSQPEA